MKTYKNIVTQIKDHELFSQLSSDSVRSRMKAERSLKKFASKLIEEQMEEDDSFLVPNKNDGGQTATHAYSFHPGDIATVAVKQAQNKSLDDLKTYNPVVR